MFRPNTRVLLTSLPDNSGVLLHLDTKFYYSLNESGVVLWQRLERSSEPTAFADLVAALMTVYEVEEEQAAADVRLLVDELVNEGLVEKA